LGKLNINTTYLWRVSSLNVYGQGPWSQARVFITASTGINHIGGEIPDKFYLYQNYPNPFNPVTKIKFDVAQHTPYPLSRGENVSLKVYDILGKEVQILVNEEQRPGTYEVTFDGSNFPSGVYFYRMISGDFSDIKKLLLVK